MSFITAGQQWLEYLALLKTDFTKCSRLRFLNPDGTTAFALDGNAKNPRAGAFIQDGMLDVNLQNGMRRKASVTLSNLDGAYEYSVNKIWFGQAIALDMGLVLSDGTEYYLPQGVFYISNPEEVFAPDRKTVTYNLVDKWAYLDGTLFGKLCASYQVNTGANIFYAMNQILKIDRFSHDQSITDENYIDTSAPIFTNYYNDKTVTLPSGATSSMLTMPYTLLIDGIDGAFADILLGLNKVIVGWIGYNPTGHLVVDASQDDISDAEKPSLWSFSPAEKQFLGASYNVKNADVYNDIIVAGELLDNYQAKGRASNYDDASDTNINLIGQKTVRYAGTGYYADAQCQDYAAWKLKRVSILQKSVTITSTQLFHLDVNNLISIRRLDKSGAPLEKHLLTGFSLPIGTDGEMSLQCTSVEDLPSATLT